MQRSWLRAGVALCAGLGLAAAVVVASGLTRRNEMGHSASHKSDKRVPVLVELFTSEGCSSCPSADEALQQLQKTQPVDNVVVIPLSEHVDYWNYIGWSDPFSSAAFSERQRGYARALRLESIYTPQMVVNGHAEFVGSDRNRAADAIAQAASAAHADVQLKPATNGGSERIEVRIDNLPAVRRGDSAEVMLAITEDALQSNVSRGENSGRRLGHTAVVRQLRSLGVAASGQPFTARPDLAIESKWKRNDLSAVVFVQERNSRRVLGVGRVSLDPNHRE